MWACLVSMRGPEFFRALTAVMHIMKTWLPYHVLRTCRPQHEHRPPNCGTHMARSDSPGTAHPGAGLYLTAMDAWQQAMSHMPHRYKQVIRHQALGQWSVSLGSWNTGPTQVKVCSMVGDEGMAELQATIVLPSLAEAVPVHLWQQVSSKYSHQAKLWYAYKSRTSYVDGMAGWKQE